MENALVGYLEAVLSQAKFYEPPALAAFAKYVSNIRFSIRSTSYDPLVLVGITLLEGLLAVILAKAPGAHSQPDLLVR